MSTTEKVTPGTTVPETFDGVVVPAGLIVVGILYSDDETVPDSEQANNKITSKSIAILINRFLESNKSSTKIQYIFIIN